MTQEIFNHDLIQFLHRSPTPFHCVQNMVNSLEEHNFVLLEENEPWSLEPGGRYMTSRGDGSIAAFICGDADIDNATLRIVGAHTDSPCLKIKPEPERVRGGCNQLSVEVYGGALLNPWFDRDLSIAGRVSYRDNQGGVSSVLIDFQRAVAIIPSLAIHLDRDVNSKREINPEKHVVAITGMTGEDDEFSFRDCILEQIEEEYGNIDIDLLLDFDLYLYDTNGPAFVGLADEFLSAARLDNLLSCYTAMRSIESARPGDATCILVCHDHEEVGSVSSSGAQSPFLIDVLRRLFPGAGQLDPGELTRITQRSLMISADNAHAVHPNYADKHDHNHRPVLNGGPVIKFNASQRYATNSETAALFRNLCIETGVPVQAMAMRADMACGSTIGPISSAAIGIPVVDVGIPQWAMHSLRETAGSRDAYYLHRVLQAFYNS
ncbi:MAG: putative M18 family aminopeptidase 2 [marine bacterium B5-7]|nr:MAG: putative M18 family aminopeptidase 2 [marine bacterium B5-7]